MSDTRNRTPEYRSWQAMRTRCNNPNRHNAKHYCLKGITVCERWNSFDNFLSDMGPRAQGTTIDRIDPSKGYCPDNCRWATAKQQNQAMPHVVWISVGAKTMTMREWANALGVNESAIRKRLKRGWSHEKAISTPFRKTNRNSARPYLEGT